MDLSYSILVASDGDEIVTITINHPNSLNSLTRAMMVQLMSQFGALSRDESTKVIIMIGASRAFCPEVDLTATEKVFKGDVKDIESDLVTLMKRCWKPIIGAINGFTIIAGFEITLT